MINILNIHSGTRIQENNLIYLDKVRNYINPFTLIKSDNSIRPRKSAADLILAKEILQVLTLLGVSKKFIAMRLGISTSTISRILNERIKRIRYKTFFKLLGFYCAYFYSEIN